MLGRVSRSLFGKASPTGRRFYQDPATFRPSTFNEAPKPGGSWKEYYAKKAKFDNTVLAIGLVYAISSITAIKYFELVFFNYDIPRRPKNIPAPTGPDPKPMPYTIDKTYEKEVNEAFKKLI